jgi:hypothetical protein
MNDETETRSAGKADSGNDHGGGGDEHAPLQTRAAFIKNWGWEFIISYNRGSCERGRAQHGYNREAYESVKQQWEETRLRELTLAETLEFLFGCHRSAPFLFFNGNTFAEVARRIVDLLFADLPLPRRREAASLAAHFVAGVLDWDSVVKGIHSLTQAADFHPDDRVQTLKGTTVGTILRLLPDGRVIWQPDGSTTELLALPESLLRLEERKEP